MLLKRLSILSGIAVLFTPLFGCGGGSGSTSSGRAGTISGRAVNESGKPIPGATVKLMPANRTVSRAIETTTTDVNGHFVLTDVAAGSYTVSVSTTATNGTPVDVQVTVTVPTGTTIDLTITVHQTVAVTNPSTGSISGLVTDARTGAPVVGARVRATFQSSEDVPSLTTFTASNGTFRLDTVPVGLWQITVSAEDRDTSRVLIDVSAGVVSQIDLTLARED